MLTITFKKFYLFLAIDKLDYLREITIFIITKCLQNKCNSCHDRFHNTKLQGCLIKYINSHITIHKTEILYAVCPHIL